MSLIVENLAAQFGASAAFVETILGKRNLIELAAETHDIDAFMQRTGDQWKYISYALGTNQRAKLSLDRMYAIDTPNQVGRALDIGCGYGGFMRVFLDRGFHAYGVEIDSDLAALARLNLSGTDPERSEVYVGDIFSGELSLGTFDLITINDVIEHLPNPIGAFNTLASMLNPGGMLGIYAPNGKSIFYAASDPHNRVFGSSILSGPLAKSYVQAMLKSTGYGLGEYFGLCEFRDLCARNGLSFRHKPHDGGERAENAMDYLAKFTASFQNSEFRTKVPSLIARAVEIEIWQYLSEYTTAAAKAARGTAYCDFNDTYLSRAWTIVCKKEN
nr:class I SAM-dependent methyltransferase [uncultured Undibacterium sp.]